MTPDMNSAFGELPEEDDPPLSGEPAPWYEVNPANGLPMLPGGCIDIEGNPYGSDIF